jgi:hypothetical protein
MDEVKYYLYRGKKLLGTITHTSDDFPWHQGVFEPEPCFDEVKHLFNQELKLLENDELTDGKWDAVWTEITRPGLKLIPISGGKDIEKFLLHIDGEETWWRT